MDAVIMAAGLGTRLRPYTLNTPKPLLAVRGRPILDWTLGALPSECNRVIVVVNYLAEQIEAYMERQRHFAAWTVVRQIEPRGTGDALRSCLMQIQSDRMLVLNGDDFFGARDLQVMTRSPAAILVYSVDNPRRFGVVEVNADGTLDRLTEKPDVDGPRLANTGAYVFPRTVFEIPLELSSRGEYEITDYVSQLARRMPVQVVRAKFWYPMGTVEAWQSAGSLDLDSRLNRAT